MYKRYQSELQNLKELSSKRFLRSLHKDGKYIIDQDKKLLNLSSNDYLGIAENQSVVKDFLKQADFSLGSASSRLLTGGTSIYQELELLLASQYSKDKALLFNSGYHANVGIMSALLTKKDVVFCDKLNHASILDGIKLSESKMFRYNHLDYQHLEELLKKHREEYGTAIIVSESLFSMDGDIADIKKLVELKEKYNAILVVDEAHAYGVFGKRGLGIAEEQDSVDKVDIIVATLGKAIGSMGAFCVGDAIVIDYLINKCRSLIFSTALPEINVAYSYYVIKNILPNMAEKRLELLKTAQSLREKLRLSGLKTMGASHIVPVVIGENGITVAVSDELIKKGYYLLPIRHPTVAKGSSRVRISLRADVHYDEVQEIPEIIKETVDKL